MGVLNKNELIAGGLVEGVKEVGGNQPSTMPANIFTNARPSKVSSRTNLGWDGIKYSSPQVYMGSDPNSGADVTQLVQDHLLQCYLLARGLKNSAWDNLVMRQCVQAIFPRGKYNVSNPIVIPPHVDFQMLGVLLRLCPTGGPSTAMSWDGSSGTTPYPTPISLV